MATFAILVGLVLMALAVLHLNAGKNKRLGEPPPPIPGDQFVLRVRGWSRAELIDILARFAAMYEVSEPEILETRARTFTIHWPDGLVEANVWFAVNYLHYPFDHDMSAKHIVAGARVAPGHLSGIPTERSAILYVADNDTDHDRIYATDDSGDHYIGDFGDSQLRPTHEARRPREVDTLFA